MFILDNTTAFVLSYAHQCLFQILFSKFRIFYYVLYDFWVQNFSAVKWYGYPYTFFIPVNSVPTTLAHENKSLLLDKFYRVFRCKPRQLHRYQHDAHASVHIYLNIGYAGYLRLWYFFALCQPVFDMKFYGVPYVFHSLFV